MAPQLIVSNEVAPDQAAIVSKEAVKEAPVKFGIGQIGAPTPQIAKTIFRVVLYLAAAVNIIIISVPQIPDSTKVTIMGISSIATTLVHSFSKLFGIDIADVIPPDVKTK